MMSSVLIVLICVHHALIRIVVVCGIQCANSVNLCPSSTHTNSGSVWCPVSTHHANSVAKCVRYSIELMRVGG